MAIRKLLLLLLFLKTPSKSGEFLALFGNQYFSSSKFGESLPPKNKNAA
jgi:hypothetical protein